jgi:hypothetical protein
MNEREEQTMTANIGWRSVLSLWLVLILVGASNEGLAQTGALDHSPTEIVKRYLSLDSKGVRLDAAGFETLRPFIDWKEEPAWGRVVVIQSFTIPENLKQWEIISKLEVVIPVEFKVIGSVYMETGIFRPEETTEHVPVRVKAVKNRWRIVEPILPPHVGMKRIVNYVRQSMLEETDPEHRATLASLHDELRKAK